MKYSLTACLVLFFSMAFAQLSVRNNAYIFVNDQVLFVNDDVNLEEPTTKIYLREEAQLIQGSGTTGNSGLGELSVYQNSEVNQFAYHYWCSPVGGVLPDNSNNNPFQINQIHDPFLNTPNPIDSNPSIPTSSYDGTISPTLAIATRWLWTFVTSNQYSQWIPTGFNGNIFPGLGFTMKGMSDPLDIDGVTPIDQTYDFRGKPNNGTITNPIAAGQFTLIGNPYPSALDAADFLWDSQNVNLDNQDLINPTPPITSGTTGALYFWEQSPLSNSHFLESYVGGYASYTCTQPNGLDEVMESFVAATYNFHLSDGSVAGSGPPQGGIRLTRRYIPIGQGFMVEGAIDTPENSVVYVKNSHRAYVKESAANSVFFRSANQNVSENENQYNENGNFQVPDNYKRFRIIVSFDELYSRELLANFHSSATDGFDYGLEAKQPNSTPSDAYWTQNDEAFVIQAHAFDENLKIPLVVDIENQQPLSFGIYDIQNFSNEQGIFIHDLETDTYVNLKNQNYHINIQPGHYTDRFEIVFATNSALSTSDLEAQTLSINQFNNTNQLVVLNPKNLEVNTIEVYDVSGKLLLQNSYTEVSNRYELSTSNLSDGVYIVNVLSKSNNAIKSQKIIVKN